jgi:hypothetical protein
VDDGGVMDKGVEIGRHLCEAARQTSV